MRQGNLEMTWMQIGKAAPVEPWMMAVVGPGMLTTVGAVDTLEKTKTFQMLVDRLEKRQLIKVFGAGHMSFGMGVGGKRRYLKPDDFTGKKVRSMGPVENAALEVVEGEPGRHGIRRSAERDGVGRHRRADDQPRRLEQHARAGALLHDRRRRRLHRRLLHGQREPPLVGSPQPGDPGPRCEELIKETIQVQKEYNWCFDKMAYDKYGTKDPSKPGVYWMTPQEVSAMVSALGDATARYVKSKTPPDAGEWVDTFVKEGRELSEQNPAGSSWIEKVDCSKHAAKIVIK